MSSRFTVEGGWQQPTVVSGGLMVEPLSNAPALLFDGETFVAAWTAKVGTNYGIFSSRYDAELQTWSAYEELASPGDSKPTMPRLGADARQNLWLVWASAGTPMELMYRRYYVATETWAAAAPIEGASFVDQASETGGKLSFGMAASGLSGVLFREVTANGSSLRLASFF
jgi:hypothetical protein